MNVGVWICLIFVCGIENNFMIVQKNNCRHILVDYARGRAILHLKPGKLYTFKNIDDGSSVDAILRNNKFSKVEDKVDYANN